MPIERVKALCQSHHGATLAPQRWGFADASGRQIRKQAGGCYGDFMGLEGTYMWAVFHGDGPVFTLEDLSSQKKKMKTLAKQVRPLFQFEGTERSLRWVQFLMSDCSPWKELHKYMIIEAFPEYVNNAGFIFTNLDKIPRKLLYNFLMAIRMPWELPESYALFLELSKTMEPALALYLSSHFWLKEGATSFNGPYTIVYPWSFLEGLDVSQAKSFITLSPKTLNVDAPVRPNIEPLWGTQGPSELVTKLLELSEGNKLTLDIMVSEIKALI